MRLNRLRCGTARFGDTMKLWDTRVGYMCMTQSVHHLVVDCVIHKAPDGFAGLRRLDAATRTWLKELTLIFERLANDYIMLVFIINCHLEIQVQEHCKH